MSEIMLTKAADEKLCELYAEFQAKEKSGVSRRRARCFSAAEDDCLDILRELHKAGLIRRLNWNLFALEDAAIVYMENRPGLLDKVLSAAGKVKGAVPFV